MAGDIAHFLGHCQSSLTRLLNDSELMTPEQTSELSANEIRKFASLVKGIHGSRALAYVIAKREETSASPTRDVWDKVYRQLLRKPSVTP